MPGPFVHNIDPVIGQVGPFYLWWYGLSYTIGFLEAHFWMIRARHRLQLSLSEVYSLSVLFAVFVLLGGRLVEVVFYEWPFYRTHPNMILAYWLGGMSTHGLLLGAIFAIWLFCHIYHRPFLVITDELAIPGAFIMAMGRIGNFIDGQIVGPETDAWWAVRFPDAPGYRHPVVLYDGLKNLLLIPILLLIRKSKPRPGIVTGYFIFLYAFFRLFVDLFRDYPTSLWGLATGQSLNLIMTFTGLALLFVLSRKSSTSTIPLSTAAVKESSLQVWMKRAAFVFLLLFSLVLPSDWTQDIPERYGKRHPDLDYSRLYPRLQ